MGSAVLPLIALSFRTGVLVEVRVKMLEDVKGDLVCQGLTVARGNVRVGPIIAHAAEDIPSNDVLLEVGEMIAEIDNRANRFWQKKNPIGVFFRRKGTKPFGKLESNHYSGELIVGHGRVANVGGEQNLGGFIALNDDFSEAE